MSHRGCRSRVFGTTADMGIAVSAPTAAELFACAGEALFSAMCDRRTVRLREERRLELAAEDLESLMVAWLNEIIYIFDAEGFLARRCAVRLKGEGFLRAVLAGEPYDPSRHRLAAVFKAATWHNLSVRRDRGRWRSTVVLDV